MEPIHPPEGGQCLARGPTPAQRPGRRALLAGLAALLAACSGGGGGDGTAIVVEPEDPVIVTRGPGELRAVTALNTVSAGEVATALREAGSAAPALLPRYDVANYRLEYLTVDGDGQTVQASALVSVPRKPGGAPSPVLAYQHGTTLRDAEAPSNHAVAGEAAVAMASAGYIVLAADYVGYGSTRGRPHPYLMATPAAAAVTDLLVAAKYWRQTQQVRDNKQLFIAGYSEGAHASLAALRALQQDPALAAGTHRRDLVDAVLGAGPYDVQRTLDALLQRVKDENKLLGALLDPGLLRYLSDSVRRRVRDELLSRALGNDADVVFQPTFIDLYLADDSAGLARLANVHDWATAAPLALYHGRDDRTVAYASSVSTLQAQQARGAGAQISLTDCPAQPADHLPCVKPYWDFMLARFSTRARNL